MKRLDGKVALISGGARGIGAIHARAIVAEGGRVVIGDILDDEGAALADELGSDAIYIHLDVTVMRDWQKAVALATISFSRLNVLVNHAGEAIDAQGADDLEQWDRILAINLTGPLLGITAAHNALAASAPSSIVNIAAAAGPAGVAGGHADAASNFGLRGLTRSVALELSGKNVRCNSIHPGVVRTPRMFGLAAGGLARPVGWTDELEDVTPLLIYLASDESRLSTGSEFGVDGGQTAGPPAALPFHGKPYPFPATNERRA